MVQPIKGEPFTAYFPTKLHWQLTGVQENLAQNANIGLSQKVRKIKPYRRHSQLLQNIKNILIKIRGRLKTNTFPTRECSYRRFSPLHSIPPGLLCYPPELARPPDRNKQMYLWCHIHWYHASIPTWPVNTLGSRSALTFTEAQKYVS